MLSLSARVLLHYRAVSIVGRFGRFSFPKSTTISLCICEAELPAQSAHGMLRPPISLPYLLSLSVNLLL